MSYPSKALVLSKMAGVGAPPFKILVDDQDVDDIIEGVLMKHMQCEPAYDTFYSCFEGGDWQQIAQRIFNFLKRECSYVIESEKWQYVSSPQAILKRGSSDCKGYALFTAGVIDAMKRHGADIDWTYRFGSYNFFNRTPGHVFVVLWPGTSDELWIDPVLDNLNQRWPRPSHAYDYVPGETETIASTLGQVGWVQSGRSTIGSAEQDLLNALKQYSDGLTNAMQVTRSTGVINQITGAVVAGASKYIPGVSLVLGLLKGAASIVSNNFGAGSLAARLLSDWGNNPLTAPVTMVEDIFNGRTYNSDQYRAAQFYQWYVLGNRGASALNKIPDSQVFPALRWFMDRLGVFISGAEHIIALTKSPADYIALSAVNSYTTTDINRVNAAYNVASYYFQFNNVLGGWANTVGVYDQELVDIATEAGESVEAAAAQAGYQDVYSTAATSGPAPVTGGRSFPLAIPVIVGLGILLVAFSSSNKKAA